MELHNTEGLQVTVLVGNEDGWLEEKLRPLVDSGKITLFNYDTNPEILEQAGLKREDVDVPVAIVSNGDDTHGSYCVISQIGESIIAHCEDKVVPLTL